MGDDAALAQAFALSMSMGLVDVPRRSNCALDVILAVLFHCPGFIEALGAGEAAAGDVVHSLLAAFQARAVGPDKALDDAVDMLRAALAASCTQARVCEELKKGGELLELLEVFNAILQCCPEGAQNLFQSEGHLLMYACSACEEQNEKTPTKSFFRYVLEVPDMTLINAATGVSGGASVPSLFRSVAVHNARSCDGCGAPATCEIRQVVGRCASVLTLHIQITSENWKPANIRAVLNFVGRNDGQIESKDAFVSSRKEVAGDGTRGRRARRSKRGGRKHRGFVSRSLRQLFAVVVFRSYHFTVFVRARDDFSSWMYYDGHRVDAVGAFAGVVSRCAADELAPYVLFYDSPVARRPLPGTILT